MEGGGRVGLVVRVIDKRCIGVARLCESAQLAAPRAAVVVARPVGEIKRAASAMRDGLGGEHAAAADGGVEVGDVAADAADERAVRDEVCDGGCFWGVRAEREEEEGGGVCACGGRWRLSGCQRARWEGRTAVRGEERVLDVRGGGPDGEDGGEEGVEG